jgi:hypothetical protein
MATAPLDGAGPRLTDRQKLVHLQLVALGYPGLVPMLRQWLLVEGRSKVEVARELGITRANVYVWARELLIEEPG